MPYSLRYRVVSGREGTQYAADRKCTYIDGQVKQCLTRDCEMCGETEKEVQPIGVLCQGNVTINSSNEVTEGSLFQNGTSRPCQTIDGDLNMVGSSMTLAGLRRVTGTLRGSGSSASLPDIEAVESLEWAAPVPLSVQQNLQRICGGSLTIDIRWGDLFFSQLNLTTLRSLYVGSRYVPDAGRRDRSAFSTSDSDDRETSDIKRSALNPKDSSIRSSAMDHYMAGIKWKGR